MSSSIEKKKQIYRKHDDNYLNFGFTSTVVGIEEHFQCVICFKESTVEKKTISVNNNYMLISSLNKE